MSDYPSAVAQAAARLASFIIGQDRQGRWLAIERHNLGGGWFKTKQAALHFVELETGRRPGAVYLSNTPLELTF